MCWNPDPPLERVSVNLLGNRVLAEVSALGWAIIQHDCVFYQKRGEI